MLSLQTCYNRSFLLNYGHKEHFNPLSKSLTNKENDDKMILFKRNKKKTFSMELLFYDEYYCRYKKMNIKETIYMFISM